MGNPNPPTIIITEEGNRVVVGAASGPQGPPGPQGPAGAPGGDPYIHTQSTPSTSWSVNHNRGREVQIVVTNSSNEQIYPDIVYQTNNLAVINFGAPHTGKAVVS